MGPNQSSLSDVPANPHGTAFDPGLTSKYMGALLRAINKDGSFNVRRKGFRRWAGSAYLNLVTMSWPRFLALVLLAFLVVNAIFATVYQGLGPAALHTSERDLGMSGFARSFFFSAQTLTTVGYGTLYPFGMAANVVAAIEAATGLMAFALATGMLFARFSRPSAHLAFSDHMVVAPYKDVTALQFRIANQRSNVLMEVEADMILMTVDRDDGGELRRNFTVLALERKKVLFLALTWSIVHPIDTASPLWGLTAADLERLQAELLILIKGFDDSFSQVVHRRYSYRWDEIEWAGRFVPAFTVSASGDIELDVARISAIVRD
jgi:inward rectifier potassium channel